MDKTLNTKVKEKRTKSEMPGKTQMANKANKELANKDQAGWVKEMQA